MITASASFSAANALLVKSPIWLVEIDGYDLAFTNRETGFLNHNPWIVSVDNLAATVSDLDGGSDVGALSFTVQDRDNAITSRFPCFVLEGSVVRLKTGFPGMDPSDYLTLWTGTIDTVDPVQGSPADYYFTCTDKKQLLSKVIFAVSDDGKTPTDSTHLRTFTGHPLNILIAVLEEEFSFVRNVDYDYDRITAYRDGLFSGAQFTFSISSPPTGLDFIEKEIMAPLGGYVWVNSNGVITPNFFSPFSVVPVVALDPSNLTAIPDVSTSDLVNTITFRFDDDGTGNNKFLSTAVVESAASVNKYGQFGAKIIESLGMRSGLQGFFLARQTANLIFSRYGNKNLKITGLSAFWTACVAEPGDFIAITHPLVVNKATGTRGIVSKLFEVVDRTLQFSDGTVIFDVIDATAFSGVGTVLIAPDSEPDYTSAGTDKTKYMFLSSDHAKYSNGDAANVLG